MELLSSAWSLTTLIITFVCLLAGVIGIIMAILTQKHTASRYIGVTMAIVGITGAIATGIVVSMASKISFEPYKPYWNVSSDGEEVTAMLDTTDFIDEGTYHAGYDIPEGVYYVQAEEDYASVERKASPKSSSYIAYESFNSWIFVEVKYDEYFVVSRAKFKSADDVVLDIDHSKPYPVGTYRIGKDIPEGTYYLTAQEKYSYFKLMKNATLEYDDTITSDDFYNFTYIEARDGEYLMLSHAEAIPAENAPAPEKDADGSYASGTYLAGEHIPAGLYYIWSTDTGCYYEVSDNTRQRCDFNEYFETFSYVTLKEGEYIFLEHGKMLPADEAPYPSSKDGVYPEGTYRIGRDIPAGTYRVKADKGQNVSVEVADDPRGTATQASFYEYTGSTCIVSAKDGEFLIVDGGTFTIQ